MPRVIYCWAFMFFCIVVLVKFIRIDFTTNSYHNFQNNEHNLVCVEENVPSFTDGKDGKMERWKMEDVQKMWRLFIQPTFSLINFYSIVMN